MIKDTRLLVEFAAVAQAGSFTQAAKELGVAQPWLSAQVRKLEEQLGAQLLDRSSRRLELTEWGKALLNIAAPLRQQTELTLGAVAALASHISGTLRIGVPLGGLEEIVLKVLRGARLSTTASEVFLERGVSESLIGRLKQGVLDLAFFVGDFELDQQLIEAFAICPVSIDLLIDESDPIHLEQRLRLEQLQGRTLSIFPRPLNPDLYDQLTGLARQAGVEVGHFAEFELQAAAPTPDTPTPIRLALSTQLSNAIPSAGLRRVTLEGLDEHWLCLARLRSNAFGQARRALWEAACNLSRDMTPSREVANVPTDIAPLNQSG